MNKRIVFVMLAELICASALAKDPPTPEKPILEKTQVFTSADIGDIKHGTTTEVKPGVDYDISGYGTSFGYYKTADAGRFVYRRIKGDFDVTCRIESIQRTNGVESVNDVGIMARKNLTPGCIFFSSVVVRQAAKDQWYFTSICRYKPNAKKRHEMMKYGSSDGFYGSWDPRDKIKGTIPFPAVYFRLKRVGNEYHAYYKMGDGQWIEHIRAEKLDLGEEPYVGIEISNDIHHSAPDDTCTTVKVRDITGFPK